MVEKIVDRKVRPVTLPGALLIWCLRFLFAEFLEARIVAALEAANKLSA
jgi:hypothetical protein